jgi:UDP-N-acetylmuramyl pentapeptide synthase
VALSVLTIPTDADPVILEAGISQEGEMDKLVEMIAPSTGIFTNLLSAHAENFSSRETHLKEKLRLFKQCKRLICSSNYPEII